MKVAGVVVLYNPEHEKVKKNINSYLSNLDMLLIVDNSKNFNKDISSFYANNKKVHYKFLGGNMGIAHALNLGIHFAKEFNQQWLLTMDQDSKFYPGDFMEFLTIVKNKMFEFPDAAIFTPRHGVPYIEKGLGIVKVPYAMTSGNLIRVNLLNDIGTFDNDLFIDSVDHEFCFRLGKLGFGVYRVNDIELEHNLGEIETKRFLGRNLHVTHHNYVRRYYITRNSLYVSKKYANSKVGFIKTSIIQLLWASITILLYENDKRLKFKSIIMGLFDFRRLKMGKKF